MIQIDNVLIADEGHKITDGEGFYSRVNLSNIDSPDNYWEVTEEEMEQMLLAMEEAALFNIEIEEEEEEVSEFDF